MQEDDKHSGPGKNRGIYLLPNLFTTAGLFAGFYAIVAAMKGYFANAAIAIFVAMVADGLDGRVARLTNTTSAFGAQYDSLADMVGFGIAPALVIYSWALSQLGKIGWLAAFIYTAGTALRLARFNTQLGVVDKRYFYGLPSPAAAGVLAGMVWFARELSVDGHGLAWGVAIITAAMGCLMVTSFRYYSFKQLDLRKHVPFVAVVVVVLIFVFISVDPPSVLFFIFLFYALSGPVVSSWQFLQARRKNRKAKK